MRKRNGKFENACDRIFRFFDCLPDDAGTGNHPYHSDYCSWGDMPISTLLNAKISLDRMKFENEKTREKMQAKVIDLSSILFSLGFVIGHSFDLTYRGGKRDVETIMELIREKQLLPYVPKEHLVNAEQREADKKGVPYLGKATKRIEKKAVV